MYIDYYSVSSHNLAYIDQATYLCIHTIKYRNAVLSMQRMGSHKGSSSELWSASMEQAGDSPHDRRTAAHQLCLHESGTGKGDPR